MALTAQDLRCDQGADYTNYALFATPDPSGLNNRANDVFLNFSGYTARMQIREAEDPLSMELLALTTGGGGLTYVTLSAASGGGPAAPANPNGIQWTVTKAQSLAMPAGVWYYDLFADAPGGTSVLMMKGAFTVGVTVTR